MHPEKMVDIELDIIYHGLSRAELSEKHDVPANAIRDYENSDYRTHIRRSILQEVVRLRTAEKEKSFKPAPKPRTAKA